MKFDGTLRTIGNVNVSEIRQLVDGISEVEWAGNTFRQDTYDIHRHTQTIHLIFEEHFNHFEVKKEPRYYQFEDALRPVFRYICEVFDNQGWVARCILARLAGNSEIPWHADENFSLVHSHRMHIPIITNDSVKFSVGEDTVQMKEGEVWEVNNQLPHSVINQSSLARVHLIVDWAYPLSEKLVLEYARQRIQKNYFNEEKLF